MLLLCKPEDLGSLEALPTVSGRRVEYDEVECVFDWQRTSSEFVCSKERTSLEVESTEMVEIDVVDTVDVNGESGKRKMIVDDFGVNLVLS